VSATVTLQPWGSGDLPLLERLMGDPRMTEHLGGPESPDKLRERQNRYERLDSGGDRMFKIVDVASGAALLEACEFEFPKGHFMACNDWCLDLRPVKATIRRSPPWSRSDSRWPDR
jgi:hypothetical protein